MKVDPQWRRYRLGPAEMAQCLGLDVGPDEFLTVTRRFPPDGQGGWGEEFVVSVYRKGGPHPMYPVPHRGREGRWLQPLGEQDVIDLCSLCDENATVEVFDHTGSKGIFCPVHGLRAVRATRA